MSKGSDRRNALKGQCLILEEKNIQLEYNLVAMTNLLKNISMILQSLKKAKQKIILI